MKQTNFETLSPLESDILKLLWVKQKMHVREIYSKLKNKKIALCSIAVLLDRLHERGIVGRKIEACRGGARYLYFPKKDRVQFEKSIIASAVNNLISKFGSTAVSYFNERFRRQKS